ncbi:MAG: GNAT family N-acetyltransferase, partial [Candidatus Omnitrophica bacterium]|nr:GNAT family N-acetyltransferase [Candidatus Omnitrophota bacterium]
HKAVELYRGRTAASREHIFPVSEGPLLDTLRRQGAASLPLPSDRTMMTPEGFSNPQDYLRALKAHAKSAQEAPFIIEKASPKQVERIAEIWEKELEPRLNSYRDTEVDKEERHQDIESYVRSALQKDEREVFIARRGDTVIGFIMSSIEPGYPIGWLEYMAVDSIYQRLGVGRSLLIRAIESLKTKDDITEIWIEDISPNEQVGSILKKLDFEQAPDATSKVYRLRIARDTFGPHSAGAAELPPGTEPKMDYEEQYGYSDEVPTPNMDSFKAVRAGQHGKDAHKSGFSRRSVLAWVAGTAAAIALSIPAVKRACLVLSEDADDSVKLAAREAHFIFAGHKTKGDFEIVRKHLIALFDEIKRKKKKAVIVHELGGLGFKAEIPIGGKVQKFSIPSFEWLEFCERNPDGLARKWFEAAKKVERNNLKRLVSGYLLPEEVYQTQTGFNYFGWAYNKFLHENLKAIEDIKIEDLSFKDYVLTLKFLAKIKESFSCFEKGKFADYQKTLESAISLMNESVKNRDARLMRQNGMLLQKFPDRAMINVRGTAHYAMVRRFGVRNVNLIDWDETTGSFYGLTQLKLINAGGMPMDESEKTRILLTFYPVSLVSSYCTYGLGMKPVSSARVARMAGDKLNISQLKEMSLTFSSRNTDGIPSKMRGLLVLAWMAEKGLLSHKDIEMLKGVEDREKEILKELFPLLSKIDTSPWPVFEKMLIAAAAPNIPGPVKPGHAVPSSNNVELERILEDLERVATSHMASPDIIDIKRALWSRNLPEAARIARYQKKIAAENDALLIDVMERIIALDSVFPGNVPLRTFGPHSAGAAELPPGTEPKMDYEIGYLVGDTVVKDEKIPTGNLGSHSQKVLRKCRITKFHALIRKWPELLKTKGLSPNNFKKVCVLAAQKGYALTMETALGLSPEDTESFSRRAHDWLDGRISESPRRAHDAAIVSTFLSAHRLATIEDLLRTDAITFFDRKIPAQDVWKVYNALKLFLLRKPRSAPYQTYEEALDAFVNVKIRWGRTTEPMRVKFMKELAQKLNEGFSLNLEVADLGTGRMFEPVEWESEGRKRRASLGGLLEHVRIEHENCSYSEAMKILKAYGEEDTLTRSVPTPPSGIETIILNGLPVTPEEARSAVSTLSNGEHIFNALITDNTINIEIVSRHLHCSTERGHTQLTHPALKRGVISGIVNNEGTILMFDETMKPDFTPQEIEMEHDEYIRLARFLIEHGFPAEAAYNKMPVGFLEEMKIIDTEPRVLGDLAIQRLRGRSIHPQNTNIALKIKALKNAFKVLNNKVRKTPVNSWISKLGSILQKTHGIRRICVSISVIENSPDIALTLKRLRNAEIIVTGVTDENRWIVEGLTRFKNELSLPDLALIPLEEKAIEEKIQASDQRLTDPRNGLPYEFLRTEAIRGLELKRRPLDKYEVMIMITEPAIEEEADQLAGILEGVLSKNISIRIPVMHAKGKTLFSLSAMLNDWLTEIRNERYSTVCKLPPIDIPAKMMRRLERKLQAALLRLRSA